ncbi:MAG: hemerythrin domain-containing protein [Anaerotruncus sp.]|nr:hemerythrin domain-containing protein [Anaerotruncus sp.]
MARRKAKALKSAARAWAWKVGTKDAAEKALADLSLITVHYTRKENQLFPFLEKHGFTGPSRVMWGKHDEIRAILKEAQAALDENPKNFSAWQNRLRQK